MPIGNPTVSVGTSRVLVWPPNGPSQAAPASVAVKPATGKTIFVGGNAVTTANGWPVTDEGFSIDLAVGEALYAIASETVAVTVLGAGG